MRKITVYLLRFISVLVAGVLLGFTSLTLCAQTQEESTTYISSKQAQNIGKAFMLGNSTMAQSNGTKKGTTGEQTMQLVYTGYTTDENTGKTITCYYVFALQPKGFVIVAADDRIEPILGYSYDNDFIAKDIPSNVRSWLNDYEQLVKAVVDQNLQSDPVISIKWNNLKSGVQGNGSKGTSVPPLIETTWDQNSPYNSWCPTDANGPGGHAYAGCEACAMAQIMRYWQYPSRGIGSHSYNTDQFAYLGYGSYGSLSVNFANTTYDYSLMPLALDNYSTSTQINEIAKLMHHCGVAVEMMYGPNGSGAYDNKAVNGLRTYFGYSDATLKRRINFSDSKWIELLKGELDNMRPLIYAGQGSYGGHAFVCDGYDSQNNFHFNWGWGGNYNGYYSLSILNPGPYDFNSDHVAIVGLDASQPMIRIDNESLSFIIEEGTTISESKSVSVLATHLDASLTATVTGNFRISANGTDYANSQTLSNTGGTLYVRYQPSNNNGIEHGYITLSSGTLEKTISLTGALCANNPSCLPPKNLSISSEDQTNINLQWETPVINADPQTLTWAEDLTFMYGFYDDYQVSMMQRFCDTDLLNYHNQELTQISFYAFSDATVYKAVVYKGGKANGGFDPGTLVLSQDINKSTLTANTWNTITLNTPVPVDATQELWFGIYMEAPANTYCMPISSQSKPQKGCIYGIHSNGSVSWDELLENYSFCIKGTVDNVRTVDHYEVFRNDENIATTTNTTAQDNLSDDGTYTYTVTAYWSNGCTASAQKQYTKEDSGTEVEIDSAISLSGEIGGLTSNLDFVDEAGGISSYPRLSVAGELLYYSPSVSTDNVETSGTSATVHGNVLFNGWCDTVTEKGFQIWRSSGSRTTQKVAFNQPFAHCENPCNDNNFTYSFTGLTPNTTYYVRAYAINSMGKTYGEEISFTTTNLP